MRMLCKKLRVLHNMKVRCGRCMPCRIQKRREWIARLLLESSVSPAGSVWFVTLTYRPESLPAGGVLSPVDFKLFIHQLSQQHKRKFGSVVRYFGVGEYGDKTMRPHYHFILFGLKDVRLDASKGGHFVSDLVSHYWPHGHIHIGEFNSKTASYTAGYVCKKMTKADDPRLDGRPPEFARMSLKPGIGADVALDIANAGVFTDGGSRRLVAGEDVPGVVRIEKKMYPLGRYLKKKVREIVGMPDGKITPRAAARMQRETMVQLMDPEMVKQENEARFNTNEIVESRYRSSRQKRII